MPKEKIKAIGLLSGGLDSTLAVRIIHDMGIDVQAVNFHTGFCFTNTRRAARLRRNETGTGGPSDALSAAAKLDIPIDIVDISDSYLDVLHNPKYGYGKNVNPCVDCRIHMFSITRQKMDEYGAQFVFTGEVLGQRPKSQHLMQLTLIAKRSGLEDRLLRPLSARLLPPTLPEIKGWVDREKLFGFHGRNRKPQMALAAELGIQEYPTPAGGCCFLTDPAYGRKVKDLWKHAGKDALQWEDYLLLKVGRHLRISPDLKVIVGRDEGENLFLDQFRQGQIRLEAKDFPGPVVLVDGDAGMVDDDQVIIAARIAARYSDGKASLDEIDIDVSDGKRDYIVRVKPFKPEEVQDWVIS